MDCPVDLLDLRRAYAVMQQQVFDERRALVGAEGGEAGLFECAALSEKLELDRARAPLCVISSEMGGFMADDVLLNKAASIERCVRRAHEGV